MSNTTKYKDGPKRSVFKTIPKNVEIVQKRQFFGNFQFIHVIFFRCTPFLNCRPTPKCRTLSLEEESNPHGTIM